MTPVSADLLRRAAEELREHAGYRATPGPWTSDAGRVRSPLAKPGMPRVTDRDPALAIMRLTEDADYVALVHPPVALALADWLDSAAVDAETIGPDPSAVAVARAVLREPGDTP